jgi:YhcH/YjgK/YiaL family protein
MIVTDLAHILSQAPADPRLRKAIEFLQENAGKDLPDGRVAVDGEQVFALFQSYQTLPPSQAVFEAHRKYLDVQYVAAGEEVIGWVALEKLVDPTPYDPAKDVLFGKVPLEGMIPVRLSAGQLAVLYPSDAHAPRLAAGEPTAVRKIVVKVALAAD